MMKIMTVLVLCFVYHVGFAQTVEVKLANAVKKLEADSQLKHAIYSLYVVDSKTGKLVFDKNSQIGLVPASTMKVVTSAAAFELLGKDYLYKTNIGYAGNIKGITLHGNLVINASGDPTLGSWRWEQTKEDFILQKIQASLNDKNITTITGNIIIDEAKWDTQVTPGGWPWEDIGNYYGAGARGLNWHENQYDLILKPGKNAGDSVQILGTDPPLQASLNNELKTGKPGSGDLSIIYLPENGSIGYVKGTVPAGNEVYRVSGSMPDAGIVFANEIKDLLRINKIEWKGTWLPGNERIKDASGIFMTHFSPSIDSINYWFLQKSVNLFGEAFVKTIAYEKTKFASTDTGIAIIKNFWKDRGIEKSALNMKDGSGLSPANRVTANALVTVLQFAKKQSWFPSFYNALPLQNSIKMKSGYIGGVRSYTGYIKSKSGVEYTFAFIINNFDGNPGTVREKMWKLLDILK